MGNIVSPDDKNSFKLHRNIYELTYLYYRYFRDILKSMIPYDLFRQACYFSNPFCLYLAPFCLPV